MPVVVLVETPDNNRGRFLAASPGEAIGVLGRHYPIGASVAQKLTRGEKVSTDSYTLKIASAMTCGLVALAMAVFSSMPSQPSSIAKATSLADPTPASMIIG